MAPELGVTPQQLRRWLRATYARGDVDHSARWDLTSDQVEAARAHFASRATRPANTLATPPPGRSRNDSDESYVLDLCDELLGETGSRQHRFDWLVGDPGRSGGAVKLPVDAYYPVAGIVIEYRERQHDEPVGHFDKPEKLTVSGVHRGEQRRRYDRRREELIPQHGLQLVIVRPTDLDANRAGRLRKSRQDDLDALRALLGL